MGLGLPRADIGRRLRVEMLLRLPSRDPIPRMFGSRSSEIKQISKSMKAQVNQKAIQDAVPAKRALGNPVP